MNMQFHRGAAASALLLMVTVQPLTAGTGSAASARLDGSHALASTAGSVTIAAGWAGEPGASASLWQGKGQGQAGGEGKGQGGAAKQSPAGGGGGKGNARGDGGGPPARAPRAQGAQKQDRGRQNAAASSSGRSGSSGRASAAGRTPGSSNAAAGRAGSRASPASRGGAAAPGASRGGEPTRAEIRERVDALPSALRRLAASSRPQERMVAGAVARGTARGLRNDAITVRNSNGRLEVRDQQGRVLLDLDAGRAGDLGAWRLRRMGDRRPTANAPAFCRSSEGHPVWGREWCLEKGFGLGSDGGAIWSRGRIDDVIFRRRGDADRLDRGGLVDVLGDVVFGRLALQSLALGLADPLVGNWIDEPQSPRILRVRSGNRDIAELVDRDRDDRVEVLYVLQPL